MVEMFVLTLLEMVANMVIVLAIIGVIVLLIGASGDGLWKKLIGLTPEDKDLT